MKIMSLKCFVGVSALGIAAAAVGCTTADDGNDDAQAATGGSSSSGGSDGAGGSEDLAHPEAVACPSPSEATITDFTHDPEAEAGTTSFGDFTETLSGGTYVYPLTEGGLTSDVSEDEWHISGDVGAYSGFGLFWNECAKVDASAFSGIRFTISGNTGGRAITLSVGTAANDIRTAWLAENGEPTAAPSFGRCEPPGDNRYDGTCASPSFEFEVPETPTTIEVSWSDLTGGKPQSSVNPEEITDIAWIFLPPAGVDTDDVEPYEVDIVVDDLGFIP